MKRRCGACCKEWGKTPAPCCTPRSTLAGAKRCAVTRNRQWPSTSSVPRTASWTGNFFGAKRRCTTHLHLPLAKDNAMELLLKRFEQPDEVRNFAHGRFEIVHAGGMTIGKATYEP